MAKGFEQRQHVAPLALAMGGYPMANQGVVLFLMSPDKGGRQLAAKASLELHGGAEIHGGGEIEQQPVRLILLFTI